ncbi:MAG TPA: beta-propeller domain-containing protein [Steroidobacteraceae bacterium]|nr:beta-propeller domain-containing protein [Steroidobacteraceae bacterium]
MNMRRPLERFAFSTALLPWLLAGLVLAGCGGGQSDDADPVEPPPPASGMLRKVGSADELERSLKSSLQVTVESGVPTVVAAPGPGLSADGSFSNTYTNEAGVDEFDYVRYDGTHLYIAPTPFSSAALPREIRILRADPAVGGATQVSSIPIDSGLQVQGIYVANGRLVMMSGSNFGPFGGLWSMLPYWAPTEIEIHVYDVDDPAHPARILHAVVDGAFVASRRVGDRVYLVSRHTPSVVLDPQGRARLPNLPLAELLPRINVAGRARALVAASDCYVTNEPDHAGYPILTTITSFSMQNPGDLANTCYNERSDGVYASTAALYISQPWSSGPANSQRSGIASVTRIHKFAFTGAAPVYAGSVEVPGTLWLQGQQDFRMNEHQGMLRVVTTELSTDSLDFQDHRLFVLRPKASELALEVVSTLPNTTRPEELGKPNEGLFGVRFMGDRAYAVTFERIDPLYVIDLANPADPRIAGTLEVPGFSDFLHPVTSDLLLGLGNDAGHVKLELFDVSLIERPQSRGSIDLGGWRSISEASHSRHAFTYLPAEAADRFAIPATITDRLENGEPGTTQSSLHQFEILGKQSAASASLQAAGAVSPPVSNDRERYAWFTRSFIHGDTVYYVRDGKVWSSSWFTPSQVQGPF